MASLPAKGWRDLRRRVRIAGLMLEQRYRLRPALFQAETELGWLAWEQADFFDERLAAEVKKVQEFENAQASLLNTSAEHSERKLAMAEALARETATHRATLDALAAEREPIAAKLEQAEATCRLKTQAMDRFERAIGELAALEKRLEARSLRFMNVENPDMQTRIEARDVSNELLRLATERKIVLADRASAEREVAELEPAIANLRAELKRVDGAMDAARQTLAAAREHHEGETRLLDRETRKSSLHMAHLDREKQKPYRVIGACLADIGIAPRNQPEILEKVTALRARDRKSEEELAMLRGACAAMDRGVLIAFYLLLCAALFAVSLAVVIVLHLG